MFFSRFHTHYFTLLSQQGGAHIVKLATYMLLEKEAGLTHHHRFFIWFFISAKMLRWGRKCEGPSMSQTRNKSGSNYLQHFLLGTPDGGHASTSKQADLAAVSSPAV